MKVGIIGVGYVGTACAKAMLLRGSCREIVLIDVQGRERHTRGVRNDLSHGEPLCPPTRLTVGGYPDLKDADVVVITAGINEKAGHAIDRADPWGRQRLLPHNAAVYEQVVPSIAEHAPRAAILAVTDPPDTLADVARDVVRRLGAANAVLSAGTFLDTNRFRVQIGNLLGCSARSVDAYVIGEHGKTQVYAWSSARVGGVPLGRLIQGRWKDPAAFRHQVQSDVIDANIDIIEATDASQHGIGIVAARIVEAILRDERLVAPVGCWHPEFGVTLSLPGVIGGGGRVDVLTRPEPTTEDELSEEEGLRAGAAYLAEALARWRDGSGFDRPPSLTWSQWATRIQSV